MENHQSKWGLSCHIGAHLYNHVVIFFFTEVSLMYVDSAAYFGEALKYDDKLLYWLSQFVSFLLHHIQGKSEQR